MAAEKIPNILETSNKVQIRNRRLLDYSMHVLFIIATMFGIVALTALIVDVMIHGMNSFSWHLFTNYPSRKSAISGLKSALVGTAYMLVILIPLTFFIGVGGSYLSGGICQAE